MTIESQLKNVALECLQQLYGKPVDEKLVQVMITRKDQEGDFTLVLFPLVKYSGKNPMETGEEIGTYLAGKLSIISCFVVVKGFLNLTLSCDFWVNTLNKLSSEESHGFIPVTGQSPLVVIEYSSPNTNKPLHLGHVRNNLLGFAISRILHANGNRVIKTNLVNDRGIHICKSMLAWKKWGYGVTPDSSGKKGDHLVGDYYVMFDRHYKEEIARLVGNGYTPETAEKESLLMAEAREMLRMWEAGDPEVVGLWEMMNKWVYDGFEVTYNALGVDFDKIYYESETYSTGREMVLEGVKNGVFTKKADGSTWVDLSGDGLDEKLLLRADGTSVYITQDIGTARLRHEDFGFDKMVYVVGNEQDYHFKVLSLIMGKLGFNWAKHLHHFSYGMVELPDGKMKSREGTVVDADDLIAEMINTAREMSAELGKLDGFTSRELEEVYRVIALGALKYFILKVDPKKAMTFNPRESVDFNGNTGPFIQYTYARIQSIFRKADEKGIPFTGRINDIEKLSPLENNLAMAIINFPNVVREAGTSLSPAIIANYVYDLAKSYNQFYHESPVLPEPNSNIREMRLVLSKLTADIIRKSMWLLGAEVPERM